jgi:hypothetical protein
MPKPAASDALTIQNISARYASGQWSHAPPGYDDELN